MKGNFLIIVFLIITSMVCAQDDVNPKRWAVGGSFSFVFEKKQLDPNIEGLPSLPSTSYLNMVFSPYVGRMVNKRLMLGLMMEYANDKTEAFGLWANGEPEIIETKIKKMGYGIFGRYLLNPKNALKFYGQPYVQINTRTTGIHSGNSSQDDEKSSYFESGLGAGALYQVNKSIAITMKVSGFRYIYEKVELETGELTTINRFDSEFNFSNLFFGFEFKF